MPPARLVRLLLQRPRPTWPIAYRFAASPSVPLFVRALRGIELEAALDLGAAAWNGEDRQALISPGLVAASLVTSSGLAFEAAEALADLDGDEFERLSDAVVAGLSVVSPTYQRSGPKWLDAIKAGLEADVSNIREATLIGACIDESGERPDRYFGLPLADLTDGQLMVYRASCSLLAALRKQHA